MASVVPFPQAEVDATQDAFNVFRRYVIAVYAVLVWDWLICLRDEYRLIWKAPWSLTKAVYLAARYPTLVIKTVFCCFLYQVSWTPDQCDPAYKLSPTMATCPLAFVELILLLRAYALWRPNKPVLVIMIFIWVSVIGCCFLFAALGAAKMPPIPGGVPCVPAVSEEKYMVAYFSLPLVYDTIFTGLLVFKSMEIHKKQRRFIKQSRITKVLIKDGVLYFLAMGALNLLSVVSFSVMNRNYKAINAPAAIILTAVLGCRLVLGLKKQAEKRDISTNSVPGASGSKSGSGKSNISMVTATTATAVDNGEAQSEPIELSQIKNHDTKVYFNIQEKAPF